MTKNIKVYSVLLLVIFLHTIDAVAWTGPSALPPSGNVPAPINTGSTEQSKTGIIDVYGILINGSSQYVNFGTTTGSTGFGVRNNGGTLEFKNSGGTWQPLNTILQTYFASGSTNTVAQIKFADGTTQTTASTPGTLSTFFNNYFGTGGASTVAQVKFADNTTQTTAAVPDNLGNHILTQNVKTNGYFFSYNGAGGNSGFFVNEANNLIVRGGVNANPNNPYGSALDVNGEVAAGSMTLFDGKAEIFGTTTGSTNLYLTPGSSSYYWRFLVYGTSYATTDYRRSLRLIFYNNGTSVSALVFNTAGQMGVGLTNPTTVNYDLEVNGTAGKNDGSTLWSNASDIRLKNVKGHYQRGLGDIEKLNPIRYEYKKDNARELPSGVEHVGFVAQDVQKVFPETVTEGDDGYLDFNMHAINVAVINAIKELGAGDEALKSENKKLKREVDELTNRINLIEQTLKSK